MAWYTAVFLGLVQGLAEFLPISSSGHLLLFEHWLGVKEGGLWFTIVLHLATLGAVCWVYRHRIWAMVRHPWSPEVGQLVLTTGITCTFVLLFKEWLDSLFGYAQLPYLFLTAGVILLLPGWVKTRVRSRPWWQATVMGVAQGIAVAPGLSRSGLTIVAGQLTGKEQGAAADFSFLMSIPIIVASCCYELLRGASFTVLPWSSLLLGFVTAFVAGLIALKVMLKLVRQFQFRIFAIYLLLLGGGLLVLRAGFQVF